MMLPLTTLKQKSEDDVDTMLAQRGSSSSSLARLRFFMSLCALPLISFCILVATASASAATWPVSASALSATLGFHQSYTAGTDSYVHSGIDIPASAGMQISSPLAGTVRFTGTVPSGDSRIAGSAAFQGTMNAVSLETLGGKTITLMPFDSIAVREGQAVSEGTRLGTLAPNGDASSSGTHLHMGYKEGSRYLDPMLLFGVQPTSTADAAKESVPVSPGLWDSMLASQAAAAQEILADAQALDAMDAQSAEGLQGIPASQLEAADASVLEEAMHVAEGSQAGHFGTIESGETQLGSRSQSVGSPLDRLLAPLRSLGAACAGQASALLDALSLVAQASAVPLPALIAVVTVLGVVGVSGAAVVGVRFLAPRIGRVLQATKRFLVIDGRGW